METIMTEEFEATLKEEGYREISASGLPPLGESRLLLKKGLFKYNYVLFQKGMGPGTAVGEFVTALEAGRQKRSFPGSLFSFMPDSYLVVAPQTKDPDTLVEQLIQVQTPYGLSLKFLLLADSGVRILQGIQERKIRKDLEVQYKSVEERLNIMLMDLPPEPDESQKEELLELLTELEGLS